MMGWVCPVCGEANGPFNDRCVNGPHIRTWTSNGVNCTCARRPWGLEPTTAPCPVHGPVLTSTTVVTNG